MWLDVRLLFPPPATRVWHGEDGRVSDAAIVGAAPAGTLMELLLKDSSVAASLWARNILMSLFSLPLAAAALLATDAASLASGALFVGFGAWATAIVCLGAVGGVAVSMALRCSRRRRRRASRPAPVS